MCEKNLKWNVNILNNLNCIKQTIIKRAIHLNGSFFPLIIRSAFFLCVFRFTFRTTHYYCCITQAQEVFNDFPFAFNFFSNTLTHQFETHKLSKYTKYRCVDFIIIDIVHTNALSAFCYLIHSTLIDETLPETIHKINAPVDIAFTTARASFHFSLQTEKKYDQIRITLVFLFLIFCSFIALSLVLVFFFLPPYFIDFQGK